GIVYDIYKRGILIDDGELAFPLNTVDYTSAAPSLIQVRYYLGYVKEQAIPPDVLKAIFREIRKRYFMIRDVRFIGEVLQRHLDVNTINILREITDPMFDVKSMDLSAVLKERQFRQKDICESSAICQKINMTWLRVGLRL